MKKLLLILLCLPMIGFGQGWQQAYPLQDHNGSALSVQQTIDGGYITVGYLDNLNNGDRLIYMVKTDGNGNEQWAQTFGGTNYDSGNSVQQTTDGGYIICGWTYSFGNVNGDVYLIKTDGNGTEQWHQTFSGTTFAYGASVQQTIDGGYIITGRADSDVFLLKTDGNGQEQWNQTFGGTNYDSGNSVQQTTDGGYIICGGTSSFGNGGSDVYLIKTDGNGQEQWNQTFGGLDNESGVSVQQTSDGGYIIKKNIENWDTIQSVFLIKTDDNGNLQWEEAVSGLGTERGGAVRQTTDGGYVVIGSFVDQNWGTESTHLLKTDANGNQLWDKTYEGGRLGTSLELTDDGGYIITGLSSIYSFYLIKTDGSGNATSTFNIPINPNRKLQKTVDILGKETKPQTNTPLIEIYDDGTVEKRIVIE